MDVIDKFLNTYNYKFKRGYLDINDKDDLLLLERILKKYNSLISENQELVDLINNNEAFAEYGTASKEGTGKSFTIRFEDIKQSGAKSKAQRLQIFKELMNILKDNENFTEMVRADSSSSAGKMTYKYNDESFSVELKGAGGLGVGGDVNVKEGLVVLLYYSDIKEPFDKENYKSRIESLSKSVEGEIYGLDRDTLDKIKEWFNGFLIDPKPIKYINVINQTLSSALTIREVYPGKKIIRDGLFDTIRIAGTKITGFPPDKWNPGDIYVEITTPKESIIQKAIKEDKIEILNDLFNGEWGSKKRPLTSVSLKQETAQGGKAKTLLNTYGKAKEDYNLTKDEVKYTNEQFLKKIEEARKRIQSLIAKNENIEYKIPTGELKGKEDDTSFLRGKFAALKSIEFLFNQFPVDQVDEAIVALVGFAISLTGVNPTFFKVTGNKSGKPTEPDTFKAGESVILHNDEGDFEPIIITDSPTFGGLELDFRIAKGNNIYKSKINARNNGNVQGTLEVQKLKHVGSKLNEEVACGCPEKV